MNEKALVIGGGGREHALAEYIGRSPEVSEVYCAPGNGGTERIAENVDIGIDDSQALASFCLAKEIDLAVVGPDDSLQAGVVDELEKAGVSVFGPPKAAARLEWDKIYAHEFMDRHNIPHPQGRAFSDYDSARDFSADAVSAEWVIKANGLAQGKGVVLPRNLIEAERALSEIMVDEKFGKAGESVLLQKKLAGKELSVFAICHGESYSLLPPCQDYKRRNNDNEGPNTGGMGAVAPANIVRKSTLDMIEDKIIQPTLGGMTKEKNPFKGILYTGIMLTEIGPQVIEYNARFGDPECQALLPLIDEDLYTLLKEASGGNVISPKLKDLASALVVATSNNYPQAKAEGEIIKGLDEIREKVEVFHAGTANENGKCKAVGGRVLNIVGLALQISEALENAYEAIGEDGIYFENMHYRTDIGSNL